MSKPTNKLLFSFLMVLIATGTLVAITGIYGFNESPGETASLESVHNFELGDIEAEESNTTLYGGTYTYFFQGAQTEPITPTSNKGMTIGEIMRWAGILAVFTAIIILLMIEFVYRDRINRMNYRVLLIISLFVLPVIIGLGTSATVLETTKTVQSCNTCHVMNPFVNDLYNPESTTLAARHYKNKWIPEYQCYTCHTTYGAHGTFEGKRDGFRHWLLFVTQTWDEPISYSGSYPNSNCTSCHAGTNAFREVPSHQALSSRLRADRVSCTSCHGPAHPTPNERDDVPEHRPADQKTASKPSDIDIDIKKIETLVEAQNE